MEKLRPIEADQEAGLPNVLARECTQQRSEAASNFHSGSKHLSVEVLLDDDNEVEIRELIHATVDQGAAGKQSMDARVS